MSNGNAVDWLKEKLGLAAPRPPPAYTYYPRPIPLQQPAPVVVPALLTMVSSGAGALLGYIFHQTVEPPAWIKSSS